MYWNREATPEKRKQKYDFYRSLGYSEKAAAILSDVTYGKEKVAFILSRIETTDKLAKLHDWVTAQSALSPMDAIDAYYRQYHQQPLRDAVQYMKTGAPSGAGAGVQLRQKYSARPMQSRENVIEFSVDTMLDVESDCEFSTAPSMAAMEDPFDSIFRIFNSTATDSYEPIEEKSDKNVLTAPTSTFRMTTSTASMGLVLNQIRSRRKVIMDQVRIEEVLNYFDYGSTPSTDAKFHIQTELLPKNNGKTLLYINAQAKAEAKEHQNIVLLLDVSGSMSDDAEVTQETIAAVLSMLNPGDRFSLITYSTEDHTVLDGYEIHDSKDKEILMGIILGIVIEGCTNGSAGIETAYSIGAKYYRPDKSNQVILITDGDLNFGITRKGDLKDLIEEKKQSGLFLSVIGTGLYNYKDDNLEVLSKHGNGTYCVVNELPDVEESVVRRYISLTNIIAKDVKAQVEFNPRRVKSWRLLGYENRELAHEDFKNDAVISEPYGSGGHGVALYELEMASNEIPQSELKYQTPILTDADEIATIKLRYKDPLSEKSEELETVVTGYEGVSADAHLAYLLYCVSEKLRGSDKLDDCDRAFLSAMNDMRLYKMFGGSNTDKLDTLMNAISDKFR